MDTPRFVWLPSSGVWACAPQQSSDGSSTSGQTGSPSLNDHDHISVHHRESARKKKQKTKASIDEEAQEDSLGFGDHARKDGMKENLSADERSRYIGCEDDDIHQVVSSSSQHSTCAICLGNIDEERGAVLQWCMHRFCTHCIEEWSRVRRVCPLCKAEFSGWYYNVQSNNEFEEKVLEPVVIESNSQSSRWDRVPGNLNPRSLSWRFPRGHERGRGRRQSQPRQQAVSRHFTNRSEAVGRLVPFPTQRSFDGPRRCQGARFIRNNEEEAAARALQWRASIYRKGLKARPFEIQRRISGPQAAVQGLDAKARAERRLEPWIRRELEVLLQDSKPDLLVRLVLAHWFAKEHEISSSSSQQERSVRQSTANSRRARTSSGVEGGDEKLIKELEPFLGDKASMFWHELRCFAQSPFTMKAYDTVVVYPIPVIEGSRNGNQNERVSIQNDFSNRTMARGLSRSLEQSLEIKEYSQQENHNQNLRAGRHTHPQNSPADNLSLHRNNGSRNSAQRSKAPYTLDSKCEQRKKRQHLDALSGAEDRWQMSYC